MDWREGRGEQAAGEEEGGVGRARRVAAGGGGGGQRYFRISQIPSEFLGSPWCPIFSELLGIPQIQGPEARREEGAVLFPNFSDSFRIFQITQTSDILRNAQKCSDKWTATMIICIIQLFLNFQIFPDIVR